MKLPLLTKYFLMQKQQISHSGKTIEYYQHGDNPKLLIHSGLHGDEYSVIPIVQEMIEKYLPQLPEFIFVPVVSPSANSMKQRANAEGIDINRSFLEDSKNGEVLANQEIVRSHHFNLLVSFHEDVEFDGFYMYDSCYPEYREDILSFCDYLAQENIKLFSGRDDPDDPIHNKLVVNGHVLWGIEYDKPLNGTFDDWAIKNKIVERLLMPETPTIFSVEDKTKVIESIFQKLIIPYFKG